MSLGRSEGMFERLKRALSLFSFEPLDESALRFDLFALNSGGDFGDAALGRRWSRWMTWTTPPATSNAVASALQRKIKSRLVSSRKFCSPTCGWAKEIEVTLRGSRLSEVAESNSGTANSPSICSSEGRARGVGPATVLTSSLDCSWRSGSALRPANSRRFSELVCLVRESPELRNQHRL
jgi:hypothetical protein